MAQRITRGMLQNAVDAYVRTLQAHDLLDGGLQYTEGTPSMGIPWSIRYVGMGDSPIGVDYGVLGHTAREAFDRLHTIIRTLNDIKLRSESV